MELRVPIIHFDPKEYNAWQNHFSTCVNYKSVAWPQLGEEVHTLQGN